MPVITCQYQSPLGAMTLACEGDALVGAWFNGQRYFGAGLPEQAMEGETPVLAEAADWLDAYFAGKQPGHTPRLAYGSTPFRHAVSDAMLEIPYGQTLTYGELGNRAAAMLGQARTSARAVGGAVGHNPLSIFIPCHRVMGAHGYLTGYAGGIERKIALLRLEGVDVDALRLPKDRTRSTAN